jgi:hypothetical protein
MSLVKTSRQSGVSEALLASRQLMARPPRTSTPGPFPDDEPVPAEESCVDFAVADRALSAPAGAAFAVLCDAAADDDPESAAVELSALAGGDEVAGAAAVAAGLVSGAGFDAVCAVPELECGVAVAITAFTAC